MSSVNLGTLDQDKFQWGYFQIDLYFHLGQFVCGMSLVPYTTTCPKSYLMIYVIIMHH